MTIDKPTRPDWLPKPSRPHELQTATRIVYDGSLFKVRLDQVQLPSGRSSERMVLEHPGSVVIVPVTVDGDVLLIQQFRYAVGEYLLELPAGLIDPGESVLETAGRELIEETGFRAGALEILADIYVSPGYSREKTCIVLATACMPIAHDPDADEPIDIIRLPLARLPELLQRGDSGSLDMQAMLGLMWLIRLGFCADAEAVQ